MDNNKITALRNISVFSVFNVFKSAGYLGYLDSVALAIKKVSEAVQCASKECDGE